jgi:NADH dehydrogenase
VSASHHVVILGGGFGGLAAARALAKAEVRVTLVDRSNHHIFQPLLYQVATGGLSPADISFPIRSAVRKQKNVQVLMGDVTAVDVAARQVEFEGRRIDYDTLIAATGARNNYFGSDGWAEFAPGLKTVEDATAMRGKILYAFEAAELETDAAKRTAWLTFLVVGGGPTGVELAGALGEIANDTLRDDFRSIRPEEARILLLDGSPRILPSYPEELSVKAERALIALGVRTRTGIRVSSIDEGGITAGAERIEARTVLWAAGVRASELGGQIAAQAGLTTDRGGRIPVQGDCSLAGHPEIFVIGDLAHFEAAGNPLPGIAPVAMQQGRYVAAAIRARLAGGRPVKPFVYWDRGNLATIGRASAVGYFGKLKLSGRIAWIIWLFVHLMYLVGFRNRLIVLLQWAYQYFTFNRGARLITGRKSIRS